MAISNYLALLLMRRLNMLGTVVQSPPLPRSLPHEGGGKFKPLSLDGRGVGERVEISPDFVGASIKPGCPQYRLVKIQRFRAARDVHVTRKDSACVGICHEFIFCRTVTRGGDV